MPDDLARQIEPIIEGVKLLGWPVLTVPGIEADDAIGTISCMAAKGGFRVVISTGDKDLAQLVDGNVVLINTMSNERLDVAGVLAKFGVPPEQDRRLPGADRRLRSTTSRASTRSGRRRPRNGSASTGRSRASSPRRRRSRASSARTCASVARMAAARAKARHRRHRLRPVRPHPGLARVRRARARATSTSTHCSRSTTATSFRRCGASSRRRSAGLRRGKGGSLRCRRLRARPSRRRSRCPTSVPSQAIVKRYETVTTVEALGSWVARVAVAELAGARHRDRFARPDPRPPDRPVALGRRRARPCYIPLRARLRGRARPAADRARCWSACRPWLENEAARKVGQQRQVRRARVRQPRHRRARLRPRHDARELRLEAHKAHTLESLAFRHLGRTALTYEEVCGKGVNQIPFAQVEVGARGRRTRARTPR